MKSDGSEQRKLVEAESGTTLWSPRWSSAGDAVYYFRQGGDTAELMRLPFSNDPTGPSVLVSGLNAGAYFTLSDDGSQLAYTRSLSYSNLWSVDLPGAGSNLQPRATPLTSGTLSYADPAISPDSRLVAFTKGSDVKRSVYKMALDGGQQVKLTSFAASLTWSPAWSPDGKEIAFGSNQAGSEKVWIVDSSGGAPRVLDKTNASETNYRLTWSPNPYLIYPTKGLHNLRRVNVETQEEVPLLPKDSGGWLVSRPVVSPDGKKIAIYWNQKEGAGVWLITGNGASSSLLYAGEIFPFGWSLDGNFVYALATLQEREILQLKLGESKKPKTIAALPGPVLSGTVSPDGRKIIVSVGEEKSDVWLLKDFDPEAARAN
jgi:Tol biopolymer transport system component